MNQRTQDAMQNADASKVAHGALSFDFWKHLLLICTTLFGILVSFHGSGSAGNPDTSLYFGLCIATLALGILFGGISLFEFVVEHKYSEKYWVDEALRPYAPSRGVQRTKSFPRLLFSTCEVISSILLSLSILGLGVQAVVICF